MTQDDAKLNIALPSTWDCTDGLGRTLPDQDEVGPVRKDKWIGMFYWIWHYHNSGRKTLNITETLQDHPGIEHDFNSPYWGNYPANFWDKPLLGYYTKDKWVYRHHAELLAAAGVDVIFFDSTNGCRVFLDVLDVLAEAFIEARRDGIAAPCFAYLLPWGDEADAIDLFELYEKIYSVGKYKELWFYWKGKPLVLGTTGKLNRDYPRDVEILNFFTFRSVQASYYVGQTNPTQWGWLAKYPQTTYVVDGVKEQITVGPAQNYCDETHLTAMNGENVYGRTHTVQHGVDTSENAVLKGANFQEQFDYALAQDPEMIFVTGWNEWLVGRFGEWQGVKNAFPDEFSPEFSRDIEPSAGILKDYYYYQLCANIRRFKGVDRLPKAEPLAGTAPDSAEAMWNAVPFAYPAIKNGALNRDHIDFMETRQVDRSGRNIITEAKTSYDAENLYFLVRTEKAITEPDSEAWMNLFISTEAENAGAPAWEHFNYMVNRCAPKDGKAVLERSKGGWSWEKAADVDYQLSGNLLLVKIPLKTLGFEAGKPFTLRFKWSDHAVMTGDIMDFYLYGSTAPVGRFSYRFETKGL